MCWLAQGGICRRLCKPGVVQWQRAQGKGHPTPDVWILPSLTEMKLLKGCLGHGGTETKENILLFFLSLLQYLRCSLGFPLPHPLASCSVAEAQNVDLPRCGVARMSDQLKAMCWEEV